jgi:hypothetical protein
MTSFRNNFQDHRRLSELILEDQAASFLKKVNGRIFRIIKCFHRSKQKLFWFMYIPFQWGVKLKKIYIHINCTGYLVPTVLYPIYRIQKTDENSHRKSDIMGTEYLSSTGTWYKTRKARWQDVCRVGRELPQ